MVDLHLSRLQKKAARLNKLGIVKDDAMQRINKVVEADNRAHMNLNTKTTRLLRADINTVKPDTVIRTVRNSMHMSQRQFGAVVGKSETTIQRWETGRQRPKSESMDQVRKVLLERT